MNYDAVFKDAMTLFKDKSLDFLGLDGIAPITEPLATETVIIEIKRESRDLVFGTQDGRGVNFESEVDLSLDDLRNDITAGKPINELKLIYLPLFRSVKLSPTELFWESTRLVKAMQAGDNNKRKIYALMIVLVGKVIDRAVISKVLEEIKMEGNVIIEYLHEEGAERNKEETARRMIAKGYDSIEVIEITGLSLECVSEIRKSVLSEAI